MYDPLISPSFNKTNPTLEKSRSLEEERLHRKQRLAATFRIFGRLGFNNTPQCRGYTPCRRIEL